MTVLCFDICDLQCEDLFETVAPLIEDFRGGIDVVCKRWSHSIMQFFKTSLSIIEFLTFDAAADESCPFIKVSRFRS